MYCKGPSIQTTLCGGLRPRVLDPLGPHSGMRLQTPCQVRVSGAQCRELLVCLLSSRNAYAFVLLLLPASSELVGWLYHPNRWEVWSS